MLKKQYNELQARYNKGVEYLTAHPEEAEKYEKILEDIQIQLSDIIEKLNMTEEKIENGFTLEELEKEEEENKVVPVVELQETKVQVSGTVNTPEIKQQSNTMVEFKENLQIATQLAKSDLVPATYQNKPANIVIAMSMANRMDIDLFTVMQQLYLVKGKAVWAGSFCKTLIEKSNRFSDLDLVYFGTEGKDDYGCYLQATRKSDNKIITGPKVTMSMAKQEGWLSNTKWKSMPEMMMGYRAMSYFARLHAPEALSGIYTEDEVIDIPSDKKITEAKDIL